MKAPSFWKYLLYYLTFGLAFKNDITIYRLHKIDENAMFIDPDPEPSMKEKVNAEIEYQKMTKEMEAVKTAELKKEQDEVIRQAEAKIAVRRKIEKVLEGEKTDKQKDEAWLEGFKDAVRDCEIDLKNPKCHGQIYVVRNGIPASLWSIHTGLDIEKDDYTEKELEKGKGAFILEKQKKEERHDISELELANRMREEMEKGSQIYVFPPTGEVPYALVGNEEGIPSYDARKQFDPKVNQKDAEILVLRAYEIQQAEMKTQWDLELKTEEIELSAEPVIEQESIHLTLKELEQEVLPPKKKDSYNKKEKQKEEFRKMSEEIKGSWKAIEAQYEQVFSLSEEIPGLSKQQAAGILTAMLNNDEVQGLASEGINPMEVAKENMQKCITAYNQGDPLPVANAVSGVMRTIISDWHSTEMDFRLVGKTLSDLQSCLELPGVKDAAELSEQELNQVRVIMKRGELQVGFETNVAKLLSDDVEKMSKSERENLAKETVAVKLLLDDLAGPEYEQMCKRQAYILAEKKCSELGYSKEESDYVLKQMEVDLRIQPDKEGYSNWLKQYPITQTERQLLENTDSLMKKYTEKASATWFCKDLVHETDPTDFRREIKAFVNDERSLEPMPILKTEKPALESGAKVKKK